jgi:hypothetical protein
VRPYFAAILIFLFSFAQAASVAAQEKEESTPQTLRDFIDRSIEEHQVYPSADAEQPAQTLTALRWANNTRGSEDGVTLLYVYGGRPLAAACVYPWGMRLEHDFESISREKFVARYKGQVVWQPQAPGVVFADIPDAPAPEATRPQRLRQIKSLAERFQATLLGWKVDNSDREELRLLSRPLYRYDPEQEGDVIDGAVLAFVMGTDPEVLLLIEAVQHAGAVKWQYAFARRTSGELEGRLQGAVVWNAKRFPVQNDPRQTHFTRGAPLPPAVLAAGTGEQEQAR